MELSKQEDLITEKSWDCLVILDACRYDYFREVYDEYLNGDLQKVVSPGSATREWLEGIFRCRDYSDVVYVSSHPFVNSRGIEPAEGFDGTNHFHEVIDVWDRGWDDELETVPPEAVVESTRLALEKFPNKRIISHFMQPHYPYLSLKSLGGGFSDAVNKVKRKDHSSQTLRSFVGSVGERLFGKSRMHKIRGFLGLAKPKRVEAIAKKYGEKELHNAYRQNLKSALEGVKELVDILKGKIVISSDHGELLGEDRLYGHPSNEDNPILRRVPWLEVEA